MLCLKYLIISTLVFCYKNIKNYILICMVRIMLNFNRFYSVFFVIVCSLFVMGCLPFGSNDSTKEPKLVIINVLDKSDFNDSHIKGSINIPFDDFEGKISSLDKKNHYVLYCADYMCMSSGFCAKLLKDAGFEHVWAYEGGMAEWYQKGYPTQGPSKLDYLKSEAINMSDDEEDEASVITAEQLAEKIEQFTLNK